MGFGFIGAALSDLMRMGIDAMAAAAATVKREMDGTGGWNGGFFSSGNLYEFGFAGRRGI